MSSPPPAGLAVEVKEVLSSSSPAIVTAMGEEGDLVSERLARGCRCFGAWLGPEVVAYGWLSTMAEWIGELGLEIKPASGEAYVWNCMTLAAHRRKGIFRTLLFCITAQARKEGLARLWIGSVGKTGEKAIAEAGFNPVMRLELLRLPWLHWLRVRAADRADMGLVGSARYALAVGGRPIGSRFLPGHSRSRRH